MGRLVTGAEPGRALQHHLREAQTARPAEGAETGEKPPVWTLLSRADLRMSRSLGLAPEDYLELCRGLWGTSLEEERERRERESGGELNAAEKGWITAALRRQLETALTQR